MNNLLLPPGDVRTLHGEVGAWALSPDGAWLAVGDALPGPDGQCALRCLEVATGRVVFEKWGGEVKGVAWHGAESLLALRVQGALTTRAVLYAVPDGAAVGSLALEGLPGRRARVSVSQGASPVAFVTPWRMETVLRERSRRRLACVLTLDPFELALAWDPDATSAVPRLPEVRPAAMALSPDGHRMAVWLGEGSVAGAHGVGRGALFTVARDGGGEVRVCEAGRLVEELTWLDADTLLLRSAWGTEAQHRGELEVVSLSRAEVTYSTEGDEAPWGWVGARATVDVSDDGERLLVAGRAVGEERGALAVTAGVVRVASLARGSTSRPRVVKGKAAVAAGAAWAPGGSDAVVLLRARSKSAGELVRVEGLEAASEGARVELALEGKEVSLGRVARSACGRWMVVTWHAAPAHAARRDVGAVTVTRLCLVDAARVAG